eukprot:Phypoly_transcript_00420.p1 GENE.Phypoly_transcript_00420~~Phypoly_transcript_00420.p1  ORF type:complete len:1013 (+),score=147.72 Phypoly_transcript_00420:21-3059(+)
MVTNGKIRLAGGLQSSIFNQEYLGSVVQSLFPGKHIISNSRKGVRIPSPDSGFYLELDLWIPDLNLAFEYQDPHHYVTAWYSYTSVATVQRRDDFKFKIAKEKGVSLVIVPCWWDGKLESLIASIHQIRPDILRNFDKKGAAPISKEIPENFFVVSEVPDVGELMLASLPENYTFDPTNWWLSEKYDGLRACYHPSHKILYSRFGRKFSIPESYLSQFPNSFLDGEIWFGRESHLEAQQLYVKVEKAQDQEDQKETTDEENTEFGESVQTTNTINGSPINENVRWEFMKLVAMDLADPDSSSLEYEKRFQSVMALLDSQFPTITIVTSFICRSKKALHTSLQAILDGGGEGVILRKAKSAYFNGRADALKKYKTHRDQEGLVVNVALPDISIKLPSGNVFVSHVTSGDRIPKVGDIVTFRYSKMTVFGVPWQVTIDRIRKDLLWEDVLRSFNSQETRKRSADDCIEQYSYRKLTHGYWVEDEGKNTRIFFDKLARQRGADPLTPETWYKLTYKDVSDARGHSLLRYFGGSLKQALLSVYPNIGLEDGKFFRVSQNYWADIENRKKFFENFARRKGFNPRSVHHWHGIPPKSLLPEKGGPAIFAHYSGSISTALREIYPDMEIDESKFSGIITENKWRNPLNRRKFMDEYAAKKGFDPLIPENWYTIKGDDVVEAQGGTLYNLYNKSVTKLVTSVYPDIGLDESRFAVMRKGYWTDASVRRFFDDFAKERGFDPLQATNWYSVNGRYVKKLKGGWSVVGKHPVSFALARAYPNIGIDPNLFDRNTHNKHWRTKENRKAFLDNFARSRGGDPNKESFWFSIKLDELLLEKGGKAVLAFYNSSMRSALLDLYPNMHLSSFKFDRVDKNHWSSLSNQRKALDNIAKKHGFDPLVADNWYTFPKSILHQEKGMAGIYEHHNSSIYNALIANYPELNLKRDLFRNHNVKYWHDKDNRRTLLVQFARARNFDPLVAKQWLPYLDVDPKELRPVTRLYGKSLMRAIADLYPALHFDSQEG